MPETNPFISYWVDANPSPGFPRLEGEHRADVAIVGAGIVGITAAYLLSNEGLSVALVDRREVVGGVTGYTTAKVTSSHNLIYSKLLSSFGEDGARTYGAANEAGKELIAELIGKHSIDCDFERADNFVY